MSNAVLPSTHPNFMARHLINLIHLIAVKTPSFENIRDYGRIYKFSNESAWVEINPSLKLYRFSSDVPKSEYEKEYDLSDFERFRPILLMHGYQSNPLSWNWLVLKLWEDGFRQIYALEMADYRKGFDYNMVQLSSVVNFILYFQTNYKKIDIIAHSMGGIVARKYLKMKKGANYVRLFLSMGSPYKGVFKFWGKMASFDDAAESARDFTDKDKLDEINDKQYTESFYLLTQVNIIGNMKRYLNTDGLFRNYPLPDMINFTIPSTHFNLNKTEKSYSIIKNFLFKKIWMFKIRLLSIHTFDIIQSSKKKESQFVSLRYMISVNDTQTSRTLEQGYYPTNDRDELYFDVNQSYVPIEPVIVFCGTGITNSSVKVIISLLYNNELIAMSTLTINNDMNSEDNIDYASFNATITEIKLSLQSNFAISEYLLE